ncbi:hypothetical protein [Phenylobacterium montanum]|uniref:Lipoprotein n=1 Tax=Phenylobacterium montanum TaxID=2823693 RepID=A0A975G316_9CAUL|nr:hypothetical protein [Caulobacter sp. S6]QUD89965.1 hypothetical protein KCG34_08905 [Caulobacter sp. S6]
MSVFKGVLPAGLIAAGALVFGGAAMADAPAAPAQPSNHLDKCFYIRDWQNWTAASDRNDVMYLRVRTHDVYKIELSGGTNLLHWPDVHIVNEVRGPDSVCYPIDLDMSVSDGHGFREHLFVKSIAKLSPEEVAAIPKKDRP